MPASRRLLPLLALLLLFLGPGCEIVGPDDEEDTRQILELPAPTGSYDVGTTTLYLVDDSRDDAYTEDAGDPRELIAQLWYPTDATGTTAPYMHPEIVELFAIFQDYTTPDSMEAFVDALATNSVQDAPVAAGGPFPVVFHSHGLGGVRAIQSTFIEDLASHGYVVVGLNHTFGAFATRFPDGRVELIRRDNQAPPFPEVVQIWAEDLRFVLDELERLHADDPDGRFTGTLDLARVGAVGHSTGGAAAVQVHTFDDRFDAALSLDAPQVGDATTEGLTDPLMLLFADPSDFFDTAIQSRLQAPGYQVTIGGTTHYNFTDLPILLRNAGISGSRARQSVRPPGTLDADRNLEIINAFTRAFFDRHLRGRAAPLLDGTASDYPEVTFQRVGTGALAVQ